MIVAMAIVAAAMMVVVQAMARVQRHLGHDEREGS